MRFALVENRSGPAAGCDRSGLGAGAGDGRAAANQHGRGPHDVTRRAGSVAGMMHLPASVPVYLCLTACDTRKSFDSLACAGAASPGTGCLRRALVVFASRRSDRIHQIRFRVTHSSSAVKGHQFRQYSLGRPTKSRNSYPYSPWAFVVPVPVWGLPEPRLFGDPICIES